MICYFNTLRIVAFSPPKERPDTFRSFVLVSVPVFVPQGDIDAKVAAKTIVRKTFADAIRDGKFNGF